MIINKRHKWSVYSEIDAECINCGIVRSKVYKGPYKLQRIYADTMEDLKEGNYKGESGKCI